MTRLRIAVASTLLLPLTLAGCSDDDPQPRIPPSSASSPSTTTPSASPDAAVEPTLPPEAEGNDEAAAEAYIRYYWDLVNYAESTGDVRKLSHWSLPSCAGCIGGEDFVREMYAKGGYSDGGEYSISAFKIDQLSETETLRTFNAEFEKLRAPTTQRASKSAEEKQYGPDESTVFMSLTWDKSGFKVGRVDFE